MPGRPRWRASGGTHVAVAYLDPDWPERVRAQPVADDLVLDGVGGAVARRAFELLDRGGRRLSFGLASGTWADIDDAGAQRRGITVVWQQRATPEELRAFTERALTEGATGRLRSVIEQLSLIHI